MWLDDTLSRWKDAFMWAICFLCQLHEWKIFNYGEKTFTGLCSSHQLSGVVWSSPHRPSSSGGEPEAQPGELNSCSHIGSTFISSPSLLGGESGVCFSCYGIKIKFGFIFALYLSICLKHGLKSQQYEGWSFLMLGVYVL